jgi:hypothetical protein
LLLAGSIRTSAGGRSSSGARFSVRDLT